jgi:dCTP deaminase
MSIRSDHWIRRMSTEHGMIEPFESGQVRNGAISYGCSSFGYDIRVADEYKVFTNVHGVVVDPKAFDARSFVDIRGEGHCLIPPNSFALARTLEYFRIPSDTLVICVGKSTYARCFSGDTRVALVDGTSATLEDMAERSERGEHFWGYSVGPRGRVIVTMLEQPRFIGRDTLLEVELDDGERIRCTPDHQFLLRDGRLMAADDLRPGVSLMPLYRTFARGYESVYQPLNGHLYPTHRLADEWNLRHGLYEDVPETHRHHVDGNRRNNAPWNIERMDAAEHIRLHNTESYGEDFDPEEHSAAIKEAFERLRADPAWAERYVEAQRRRAIEFWNEPDKLREDIDEEIVRAALDATGSIRGAARYLGCDRSVFRRFPDVLAEVRGRPRHPANHKIARVRSLPGHHDVYCLTVSEAGNFALEAGVFVRNCGIIVNVTPLEPEWEGHLTLEISNTTPLPAKIYSNEGIAQLLFFEGDEVPSVTYAQRSGKYQKQEGVTLPRM